VTEKPDLQIRSTRISTNNGNRPGRSLIAFPAICRGETTRGTGDERFSPERGYRIENEAIKRTLARADQIVRRALWLQPEPESAISPTAGKSKEQGVKSAVWHVGCF